MVNGRLVVDGLLSELTQEALGGKHFDIEIKLTEITAKIIDSVNRINGVLKVQHSPDTLLITCSQDLRPQIAKAIVEADGLLTEMKIQGYALEDIYLKYFREA